MTISSRIAALTGPDRAVDAEVAAVAKAGLPGGCDWAFKFPNWEADLSRKGRVNILGNVNGNGDYIAGHFLAPAFTASLDAALSVVPEGWDSRRVGCTDDGRWYAELAGNDAHMMAEDADEFYVCVEDVSTPALALLAAALKARGL